ncbi:hypothetical protein D1872_319060 [compost metagenome]
MKADATELAMIAARKAFLKRARTPNSAGSVIPSRPEIDADTIIDFSLAVVLLK